MDESVDHLLQERQPRDDCEEEEEHDGVGVVDEESCHMGESGKPKQTPRSAPPSQELPLMHPYTISVCGAWIALNVLLSVTNKWLFRHEHFEFPVLIIILGTFMTFVGSATLLFVFHWEPVPPMKEILAVWKVLLLNSFAVGLSTGLENVAIMYTSISLNQAIKAGLPAVAMIAAYLMEGKTYSPALITLNTIMILGVIAALYHNPTFTMLGFITSVISTILNLVHVLASAELLRRPRMTSMVVMMLSAPFALVFLFPLFMWLEYPRLSTSMPAHESRDVLAMFGTSLVAFVYILLGLEIVRVTSAVYSTIVANLKVVILVAVSTMLFVTPITTPNIIGLVVTFASFCSYNYVKVSEAAKKQQQQGQQK